MAILALLKSKPACIAWRHNSKLKISMTAPGSGARSHQAPWPPAGLVVGRVPTWSLGHADSHSHSQELCGTVLVHLGWNCSKIQYGTVPRCAGAYTSFLTAALMPGISLKSGSVAVSGTRLLIWHYLLGASVKLGDPLTTTKKGRLQRWRGTRLHEPWCQESQVPAVGAPQGSIAGASGSRECWDFLGEDVDPAVQSW